MTVIKDLSKRFIYKKDWHDRWSILKGDGPVVGDCEDFALTLIWLESNKSMFKFFLNLLFMRYVIYLCRYKGEGHAVVKHNGAWADNLTQNWMIDLGKDYTYKIPLGPLAILFYLLKRL